MKRIHAVIAKNGNDWFLSKLTGEHVVIESINRDCWMVGRFVKPLPMVMAEYPILRIDERVFELHLNHANVEFLDATDVPESHRHDPYLTGVWIVTTARSDAWDRQPPADMNKFAEEHGVKWIDERIYDVARSRGL